MQHSVYAGAWYFAAVVHVPAGASAQGGQGGRPPLQKNWDGGGAPPNEKHRKAQKNDESALRAARSARRAKGKACNTTSTTTRDETITPITRYSLVIDKTVNDYRLRQ